jgi:iron uptake system EfeUOB component EfeO/EfeM
VPRSRGAASIAAAVALATAGLAAPVPATARAAGRPCSSYPAPGSLAPASARIPARLLGRYAVLRRRQRRVDRLARDRLSASLSASGLIMSGTRFLGRAAYGGRIYLIPARHLLGFRLAPARCLPRAERPLEQALAPQLRDEYRHAAVCVEIVYRTSQNPTCAAASAHPEALLFASGTPGFGLVPDGVPAVTVSYRTAPPRTVAVHRNFFVIVAPARSAAPCGVQWLGAGGSVVKSIAGCSYLAAEKQQLDGYRAYVAGKLATLESQVAALASAIGSGSLAQSESAWLAAHLTWLEIGQDDGAYGCFGELGGAIDGLAAGHPLGTADPHFTGFHRIELDLWTDDDLVAAASDTATLQSLLSQLLRTPLSHYLPASASGIGSWVLRPHEVLEDALRDSLSAEDDYGSGTDLASITADVAAVRELLSALGPVLDPLAPHLEARVGGRLDAILATVEASRVGAAWVSVQALPVRQRQQLDADVGAALELLAPVPELLTSTGPSAPLD